MQIKKIITILILFLPFFCFALTETNQTFDIYAEVAESSGGGGGGGSGETPDPINISSVEISDITIDSAHLIVITNNDANCEVSWGETTEYLEDTIYESGNNTDHEFDFVGLADNTLYHFKVRCEDSGGYIYSSDQTFTTLEDIDIEAPANVSDLSATAGDSQINLTWINPSDTDFAGVMIRRSDVFYLSNVSDGIEVYNGNLQQYLDTGIINDTVYYYTVFSYDFNNNYSSGAIIAQTPISSVVEPKPEPKPEPEPEPKPEPELPVEVIIDRGDAGSPGGATTTPEIGDVDGIPIKDLIDEREIDLDEKIKLKIEKVMDDITITQDGKDIFFDDNIIIPNDKPFEIGFDCDSLPDSVKIVVLNLNKDGTESSFILCSEGDGDGLKIMPPRENGKYILTILFLDYNNEVIKKVTKEISILQGILPDKPEDQGLISFLMSLIGGFWETLLGKIVISCLIFFLVFFVAWYRRKREQKLFETNKWRKIEVE